MNAFAHAIERQHQKTNCTGFTLIELFTCIAIISITLGVAVPSFVNLYEQHKAAAAISNIKGVVNFARFNAVSKGREVTLCPIADDGSCGLEWSKGIQVFIDQGERGKLEAQDTLLWTTQPSQEKSTLRWSAFGRQQYISFSPQGFTLSQNGSFIYCPASRDTRYAKVLILNKQGRARTGLDRNKNGIPENASGKDIGC